MDDTQTRHLVGVWNPSYGSDVMESHIVLLREKTERHRAGQLDEERVLATSESTTSILCRTDQGQCTLSTARRVYIRTPVAQCFSERVAYGCITLE